GIQYLSAQWQDGLEILVARLLGGTARRIAFDQEQFGAIGIGGRAVRQLAREGGALRDLFANDLLGGLHARGGMFDRELRDRLAGRNVLVQPQREGVVDRAFGRAGGVARRQAFLGLARELWIAHLHTQYERHAFPHVLGRQLDAARQEIPQV